MSEHPTPYGPTPADQGGAGPQAVAPRVHRTPGRARRIGELSAVAVLAAALASGGTYAATSLGDDGVVASSSTAPTSSTLGEASAVPVSDAQKQAPDWQAVAKAVSPSVVAISVKGQSGEGQGSGVIIDTSGHVLTNNHVVSGAGTGATVTVTTADGLTYAAKTAGTDPSTDLAVLTLTDPPKDLAPITLGSSAGLEVGDPVMAIGNPLGLAGTVTTGVVSALDRPVTTQAEAQSDPFAQGQTQSQPVVTNAVQTSAAINPGNSGGALVDAAGRLIGINSSIASTGSTAGQSGSIGIGFAIPVDEARMIADQLIATGSAKHSFLGVAPQDGTATQGSATRSGAQIASVTAGSSAAKAGMERGDVVVAVAGAPVTSAESLVAHIREQKVGSTIEVTVIRDGAERTLEVTLGERTAQ